MDDKESTLEALRAGLKNLSGTLDPYYGAIPPEDFYKITMPDDDLVTITSNGAGYSYPNTTIPQSTWTTGTTIAPNVYIAPNTWSTSADFEFRKPSAKISLEGDDADIDINGRSLMKTLDAIQDRLNMLRPDPEMEAEWDELQTLRDQYEEKLKQCREKSRAWKALKQQG